jgi:hypothetical protein
VRLLKITIIAVFIVFPAACFLPSFKKNPLQTHHAQTVLKANSETVKGDFERENRFEFEGAKAAMSRNGDEFFIRFDEAEIYKIEAVVGDEKLEEYIARKDNKLVILPLAYDLRQKRWTHLTDTFLESGNADFFSIKTDWETNCATCHLEMTAQNFPTDCASCHSKTLHDSEMNAIRLSAREHQGILRSVCFVKNKGGNIINCQSCHSADVREKPTEQACINCHQQFFAPEAIFEHSKHLPNSANCFSCHQPETAYGHLEFQRTHEISIPNPELTAAKNIPNACNLCHVDKSVNWSIRESKRLWGTRFREAKISNDSKFNRPESVRAFSENNTFSRALAADALRKHADSDWFEAVKINVLHNEKSPLVRHFLGQRFEQTNSFK